MYQFIDDEQTRIMNTLTGTVDIQNDRWLWDEYRLWVAGGGVTAPWHTPEQKLAEAKTNKYIEIRQRYALESEAPVTTSKGAFNGGFESAAEIRSAVALASELSEPNITLVKYSNRTVTVTLAEALQVARVIGAAARVLFFKKQGLMVQTFDATTVEEVAAITWGV